MTDRRWNKTRKRNYGRILSPYAINTKIDITGLSLERLRTILSFARFEEGIVDVFKDMGLMG